MKQEEIIKEQTKIKSEDIIGIYFLIYNNEIVYVGQSLQCKTRIGQHTNKKFDGFTILPTSIETLKDEETKYIYKFTPKYNKSLFKIKKNKKFATKSWVWNNKKNIPTQKVECLIIGGQIYILKENLNLIK